MFITDDFGVNKIGFAFPVEHHLKGSGRINAPDGGTKPKYKYSHTDTKNACWEKQTCTLPFSMMFNTNMVNIFKMAKYLKEKPVKYQFSKIQPNKILVVNTYRRFNSIGIVIYVI